MSGLQRLSSGLRSLADHPISRLLVGLVVAVSAIDDLAEKLTGIKSPIPIDFLHGAILFGIAHMLRALADIIDGLDYVHATVRPHAKQQAETGSHLVGQHAGHRHAVADDVEHG